VKRELENLRICTGLWAIGVVRLGNSRKNFIILEGPGEFFTSRSGKAHDYPNKLSESATFQIKEKCCYNFNYLETVKLPTVTILKKWISGKKRKHPHEQFTTGEHDSN